MYEMGQGTKHKKHNINANGRFSKPSNYFMESTQHWGTELPCRRSALSECSCVVNVESSSLYFCLQNNKCMCIMANTKAIIILK